eukprot:TRINITY_DN4780_c0_g1_i1.p1 TRINITY_DN4780_c0_g1~~TRINITY_DN4780_c0_g1_i1.p1  ORF type:complete len:104 (+),score=13.39 TRINITY_DN4780_c0_g1_i1:170-481(+)
MTGCALDHLDHRLYCAPPSLKWVDDFVHRHREKVAKRKGNQFGSRRVIGTTPEAFHPYMKELDRLYKKHEYEPVLIVNFDETGLNVDERDRVQQGQHRLHILL